MCGRYNLRATPKELQEFFNLFREPEPFPPRYNIAPTQTVIAIRDMHGRREAGLFRWGLVPVWAKDLKISSSLINARADTVDTKPAFRSAYKRRRCLIPASGFYEWQPGPAKVKQPFHIHRRDDAPLAFAGLWELWDKGEIPIESCSIITTDGNDLMQPIHNRMPVILPRDVWDVWLDPEVEPSSLGQLLKPYAGTDLDAEAVSTVVNNVRNTGEERIELMEGD
jgi:putative SOS response-associated peptidase YedK